MTTLSGAPILVIGASGGLGSEIARLLGAAGARLILSARYASALEALSIPGAVLPANLANPAEVDGLAAAAAKVHGRLDGIVFAAAAMATGPAASLRDDTLANLFAVNTFAPIRLIRSAHGLLTASAAAGHEPFVVTISGVVSDHPAANRAAYSASKAAIHAFGQAMARELERDGIRILDARPGSPEPGLAPPPMAGAAPRPTAGIRRDLVARRIVEAIVTGELDLPGSAFAD